jgi:hypothetical protein
MCRARRGQQRESQALESIVSSAGGADDVLI